MIRKWQEWANTHSSCNPFHDYGFYVIMAYLSIPFVFALYELIKYGEIR